MENDGKNLIHLVSWKRTLWRLGGALLSAILLFLSYPPFSLSWLAWFALVPILMVPTPATRLRRFFLGYFFGLVFSLVNLWWLNTIGFAAGGLLSFYTALWPALWYLLSLEIPDFKEADIPAVILRKQSILRQWLWLFACTSLWVLTEYGRSYLFTGFSWNQLGISQWNHSGILILSSMGGVYFISFIIALVNVNIAMHFYPDFQHLSSRLTRRMVLLPTALILVGIIFLSRYQIKVIAPLCSALDSIKILGVQGNIPQCRNATLDEFYFARDTYLSLTKEALQTQTTDLVVWPESAVPIPIFHQEVFPFLRPLFKLQETQWLIGSIDFRAPEGLELTEENFQSFNSAFLLNSQGHLLQTYDKIHIVPFGEFTPFAKYLPFLERMIGMGRSLSPGEKFTIFNLPKGAKGGVNICYEDAYPEISRQFTRNGATILFTITNDAWYAESAGPEQHYIHAIFRAVENGRPLFRSGNNSDTCLILPNGQTPQSLKNPETGSRFYRGFDFFDVPLLQDPPLTFYTLYGDWIVTLSLLIASVALGLTGFHRYKIKKQNMEQLQTPPIFGE